LIQQIDSRKYKLSQGNLERDESVRLGARREFSESANEGAAARIAMTGAELDDSRKSLILSDRLFHILHQSHYPPGV
jgi:hypothetical protein